MIADKIGILIEALQASTTNAERTIVYAMALKHRVRLRPPRKPEPVFVDRLTPWLREKTRPDGLECYLLME